MINTDLVLISPLSKPQTALYVAVSTVNELYITTKNQVGNSGLTLAEVRNGLVRAGDVLMRTLVGKGDRFELV